MALTKINNNTLSAVTALPAAIATGKVLQVVQDTHGTEISTSSPGGAEVDSGVSASITPSSSSNKILVIGSVQVQENKSGSNTLYWRTKIKADSSTIYDGQSAEIVSNDTGEFGLRTTVQVLHSANSKFSRRSTPKEALVTERNKDAVLKTQKWLRKPK